MNVSVASFRNPFSFFCVSEDVAKDTNYDLALNSKDICIPNTNGQLTSDKTEVLEVNHGQYVAVLWNNKWARGVVTMEDQFHIWLVDYGLYIHVNNNTVYVNLPQEYKKHATKVFEASIHGVTPLYKELNDMCQFEDKPSTSWNAWVTNKAVDLIASADKVIFSPVAVLSTKENDVVLGDLYLKKGKHVTNFVNELQEWPGCLEKNEKIFVEKLSTFYGQNRRKHRACLHKPTFPNMNLPTITTDVTLDEYNALCAASPAIDTEDDEDYISVEGSTITYLANRPPNPDAFKITAEEIEKYAHAYITIAGKEYNVLNVLINKTRDLKICEQYKDAKSVGRATTRRSKYLDIPQ